MNQNENNPRNTAGYPQQNNFMQGGYPGAYFGQQGGMQNYPTGSPQAGAGQNPGFQPGMPGYHPQQTAEQTGYPRYFAQQNTPNATTVTGYPPAGNNYGGQAGYPPAGNSYNGQTGYMAGYPASQSTTYQTNPIAPGYPPNNSPQGIAGNGGSFIPQTPYSPGYTSPGYEPPVQNNRYQNGYNAYSQMGREPQNTIPQESYSSQMPLNGGGYVPPPVPVRRRPFELSDPMLILISAVLLVLFIIAVPVMGNSQGALPLKILFLALAAGFTALLWIKRLTAENKRLCFTIVAAALCIATIVSFVSDGAKKSTDTTTNRATGAGITITDNIGASGKAGKGQDSGVEQPTAEPASTPAQDDEDQAPIRKVLDFFEAWENNRYDEMIALCAPSWRSKKENAKPALFSILQNRRPTKIVLENITGTSADTSRQIIANVQMDYYNNKPPVSIRMTIGMMQENNDWFVDPDSLISYKIIETPDPNITPEPTKAPEPYTDGNTKLYYNPNGGKLYHRDPNCQSASKENLPFKGQFLFSQVNDQEYLKYSPCNVCNAPLRPEEDE